MGDVELRKIIIDDFQATTGQSLFDHEALDYVLEKFNFNPWFVCRRADVLANLESRLPMDSPYRPSLVFIYQGWAQFLVEYFAEKEAELHRLKEAEDRKLALAAVRESLKKENRKAVEAMSHAEFFDYYLEHAWDGLSAEVRSLIKLSLDELWLANGLSNEFDPGALAVRMQIQYLEDGLKFSGCHRLFRASWTRWESLRKLRNQRKPRYLDEFDSHLERLDAIRNQYSEDIN